MRKLQSLASQNSECSTTGKLRRTREEHKTLSVRLQENFAGRAKNTQHRQTVPVESRDHCNSFIIFNIFNNCFPKERLGPNMGFRIKRLSHLLRSRTNSISPLSSRILQKSTSQKPNSRISVGTRNISSI
jgi:hypothetical protein